MKSSSGFSGEVEDVMRELTTIINRGPPTPWGGTGKIPWDDPEFSTRMLREHLSQTHDAASRKLVNIDRHVTWLHETLLAPRGRPAKVLDLGCGPGLYLERLSRCGHTCVGIDFSPASIAYARETAARDGLSCTYRQADLRDGGFGEGFDLVMLLFSEFNAFRRSEAAHILREAHGALVAGGALVLEVRTMDDLRLLGHRSPTWYTSQAGLFSDGPHLCLRDAAWSAEHKASVERYSVIEESGAVAEYINTLQAYEDEEYTRLLVDAGFGEPLRFEALGADTAHGLFVLVGQRALGG